MTIHFDQGCSDFLKPADDHHCCHAIFADQFVLESGDRCDFDLVALDGLGEALQPILLNPIAPDNMRFTRSGVW